MWLIYNILLTIASPIWVPWMLVRTYRRKEKPNWNERTGNYAIPPRTDRRRIWFHAVSVGEVVAARPILRELRKELPAYEIVLSVTTSSGHQTAREKAEGLFDHLVYFPIDVPRFMLAAMQRVRPDVVAVMETELWMNFLWAAKVFDAQTVLVNGRISDRSYKRSMWVRFFYESLLSKMDRCLMQSPADSQRIRDLGAKDAAVFGNCKFDEAIEGLDADADELRTALGIDPSKPVVVVGSLRAEEFGFFAESIKGLTGVQWIIAPRHLEKTDDLVAALSPHPSSTIGEEASGASSPVQDKSPKGACSVASRSKKETMPASGMLILDTYGELAKVYGVADFAIVGGGFANLGGQNIIQPLAHGRPVLHGPHMQNFRDVAEMAHKSGATIVCSTPDELGLAIRRLLSDTDERSRMGEAASKLVKDNVGASVRYAKAIAEEVITGAKRA